MSLTQISLNNQIRENRSRMRHNIKLNLIQHEKKKFQEDVTQTENPAQIKTESHVQILKRVGLVQKEYIQGHFEDAYDLKEKIGQGAHATVYCCIQKSTGKKFAVKITKQGDQQLIEGSKVQFKTLKNLDHQNVMKAEAFYTDRVKLTTYLVCELCSYPQLAVYMRNNKNKCLPEAQATTIISSILKTLQYLHKHGVCHRDIKPQNILYDHEKKQIKIIDFDCAIHKKESDSKFEMWTKTGSFHYQAPEFFNSTIYDEKIDLWATGVLAYEMVSGSAPFNSLYYNRMIKMITQDEAKIDTLNVSDEFKLMLKKLLEKNPSKRYSASQCLRLPILLKKNNNHVTKFLDDFNIKLKAEVPRFLLSQTQISMRRSETTICGNHSPLPILKYYCFVAEI